MNIPYPQMAMGEASPGGPVWVVRLRNPLLLARVADPGDGSLRLDCWPWTDDPGALERPLARMVRYYRIEVEEGAGAPEDWSHVFRPEFRPPARLILDNERSEWTGILEPEPRRLWHLVETGGQTGCVWDDGYGGRVPTSRDARLVGDWYADYLAREDGMMD